MKEIIHIVLLACLVVFLVLGPVFWALSAEVKQEHSDPLSNYNIERRIKGDCLERHLTLKLTWGGRVIGCIEKP